MKTTFRKHLGITVTAMAIAIVLLMTTSAFATTDAIPTITRNYTSWVGQFRMITNNNSHICGYKNGDDIRITGVQSSMGIVPNFLRDKTFSEVEFTEGYLSQKIATSGFSVYYGEFQIFDEYRDIVQDCVQKRYSKIFEMPETEVELNQETLSFATMKFERIRCKTYGAHKFFEPNECKTLVGYLKFSETDNLMTVPVYIGEDITDAIYNKILGFDPNEHFDVYGKKDSKISGIKAYGYADFLIAENYSIEGMIAYNESVAILGYQEHPECMAPSNITENGPIRSKSKSTVNIYETIGFTNIYCEAFIFPEWVDAATDYAYYIIDKYGIPEGPNQMIQAFITGATHFEQFSYEKHVGTETSFCEGEYGSHIFFTSKTIRHHIGYIWFANGQSVNFYMGDFYGNGKLVFGFAAGFRQPVPTATPEPTATPKPYRPQVTPKPTCPPCQPTCPPCQPTCQPTCPPKGGCTQSVHLKIGIGVCFELDVRRECVKK